MPLLLKKAIPWALKIGLTLSILWWLITQDKLNLELLQLFWSDPLFLILLAVQMAIFIPLNTLRWRFFLKPLGLEQNFWRLQRVTWVGFFFNTVLPGAVTGDLVKAMYVIQPGVAGQKTCAATSLVLDRFTGLFGLIIMAAGALTLHPSWLTQGSNMSGLAWSVLVLFGGTLLFYGLVLWRFEEGRDPVLRLFSKLPLGERLARIYSTFKSYENHPGILAGTLGLTVAIHSLIAGYFYLVAHALGLQGASFFDQILIMPLGLITTALPISPGGLGLGHAAFDQLYQLFGMSGGADVFNFYLVIQLLGFAPGGLIYLLLTRKQPLETKDVL
ncbi:MAG: lysylphosphatidylglycerol synthase transmembrane domain-containing protein [bacterium]|nr:lysylphosphatidylglycerol synthase transmembrane domain-containing protein [bacterium]